MEARACIVEYANDDEAVRHLKTDRCQICLVAATVPPRKTHLCHGFAFDDRASRLISRFESINWINWNVDVDAWEVETADIVRKE